MNKPSLVPVIAWFVIIMIALNRLMMAYLDYADDVELFHYNEGFGHGRKVERALSLQEVSKGTESTSSDNPVSAQ